MNECLLHWLNTITATSWGSDLCITWCVTDRLDSCLLLIALLKRNFNVYMLLGVGSANSLNLPMLISWENHLSLLLEQLDCLQEGMMTPVASMCTWPHSSFISELQNSLCCICTHMCVCVCAHMRFSLTKIEKCSTTHSAPPFSHTSRHSSPSIQLCLLPMAFSSFVTLRQTAVYEYKTLVTVKMAFTPLNCYTVMLEHNGHVSIGLQINEVHTAEWHSSYTTASVVEYYSIMLYYALIILHFELHKSWDTDSIIK